MGSHARIQRQPILLTLSTTEAKEISARSERVDSVVDEDVLLMKVCT